MNGEHKTIRDDIIIGEVYGGHQFNADMECFIGKEIEICETITTEAGTYYKAVGTHWNFTNEMFES